MLSSITVDLKAIEANLKQIKKLLKPGVQVMAVVKSHAYGHGLLEVAKAALHAGASHLGVVTAEEAMYLRRKGIIHPIVVLGAVSRDDIKELIRNKVTLVIYSEETYRLIFKMATMMNRKALIWVKMDTGINRLGLVNGDTLTLIKRIAERSRYLQLDGLYSHLASVEDMNQSYTNDQILQFERLVRKVEALNIKIPHISLAASAAAIMLPNSRFNMVRIGIAMYGLWPSRGIELWCKRSKKTRGFKLKPALSYKTHLIQIKRIKAGSSVGYGSTFKAPQNMTIGIIPVGYFDGLPRSLSNMGFVLVKGAVVPIIGRISMNMTILDLSKRPRSKVGDEVVLLGDSMGRSITATEVADWADTMNYEIVSRLPMHIPRIYKD